MDGSHRHSTGWIKRGRLPLAWGVLFFARTLTGRLWAAGSVDDGMTRSEPAPTALIHPDAPPMLFHLSVGRTFIAFHHNRHLETQYDGSKDETNGMQDRFG